MSLIPLGFWAASGGGAGGAAFDLLETTTLASSASSVTFSGLGAYTDYKHLQIRAVEKNSANSFSTLYMQVNSDTGANYARHILYGNGSAARSSAAPSSTFMAVGGSNDTTSSYTASIVDILDFSNNSKNTTIKSLSGYAQASSPRIWLYSGAWFNTSAVTSITIIDTAANLGIGSRFSLYGVK